MVALGTLRVDLLALPHLDFAGGGEPPGVAAVSVVEYNINITIIGIYVYRALFQICSVSKLKHGKGAGFAEWRGIRRRE